MRIISGKWRGRRLASFQSKAIRPTTDRVKETIFNMIGPDIVGAKVLDLFTGTGSLCFESISRGAEQVVAVDSGSDSKKVFMKNKSLLEGGSDIVYRSQDVFQFLSKNEEEAFDFILIDPPFTQKLAAQVIRALAKTSLCHEDTRIFIECVKGEETIEDCESIVVDKIKNYGDKSLYTYRIQAKGEDV